jgi:hypothetical protein
MFLLRQNLPFSQKSKQHQLIILARRAHQLIIQAPSGAHHQIINPNKQGQAQRPE